MENTKNNKFIISKTALIPLGLVITMVTMAIAGTFWLSQIKTNIAQNAAALKRHIINQDVHQPFRNKLRVWYSRTEGEKLQATVLLLQKRLDSIESKIDILIASQRGSDRRFK